MSDKITPIRPGADAGVEKADAWFHSLPAADKERVVELGERLAKGEIVTATAIRRARPSPSDQAAKLADRELAMEEVITAEAMLDLLVTLFDATDGSGAELAETLGTDDSATPRNALRGVQRALRRAREALDRAEG